jgi:hypothetical protein
MNATLAAFSLDHLSNDDLLTSTRAQVGRCNRALAGLLAHLAEVDARGLYRLRACSSLGTYCVYELRMSEDTAQRRSQVARIARRFPVLFEQIAAGQIHLTAVLMLGPHLTDANHREVLALAKHRSKREIAGLLRRLDPLPDVPARIEPLGPAPQGHPLRGASHAQFTAALAGPVRELPPGDRPSDWLEGDIEETASAEFVPLNLGERAVEQPSDEEPRADSTLQHERLLTPQRYKVQFTASQEYVDLLEQAQDLLAPAVRRRDLEQVHLRALRALVAELKKRKYAVTDRPRSAAASAARSQKHTAPARSQGRTAPARSQGRTAPARSASRPSPSNSNESRPVTSEALPASNTTEPSLRERERNTQKGARSTGAGPASDRGNGKSGSRTIPAAVRRAVAERDQYRCTYVDDTGHRCRETSGLELHHEHAYALGGPATVANIAMRCRAHNALAAEQDYGREFMERVLLRASVPTKRS